MKERDIQRLENTVYKTSVKDFRTFFNNTLTHDQHMHFVFKTLGVPTEGIVSVAPRYTSNVSQFFEEYRLKGKYRVVFLFRASQRLILNDSGKKEFQPRDPEIFVWLVRDENGNYDEDFIKIVLGKNAGKEFAEQKLTEEQLNQIIKNALQSITLAKIIDKEEVEEQVHKSIFEALLQSWILNDVQKNKSLAEVFKESPAAYFGLKGLEVASSNIKQLRLSDGYWNPNLKPYTPIFSGNTIENAFAVGIYNGIIDFLSASADAVSFFLTLLHSPTQLEEFVNSIKKLLEDENLLGILLEGVFKDYKKIKSPEQLSYQVAHDMIAIIYFFIGIFQFANGVANFAKVLKKALVYIKKYGRKGIDNLKKLDSKQIEKIFTQLGTVDPDNRLIEKFITNIEELKKGLKKFNVKNKYSDASLEKIFAKALELKLTDEELIGFIKVGNVKDISLSQLRKQMDNYVNIILKRGYPFKFKNLKEFKKFSGDLLKSLNRIDISIDDVRVQGSSLRRRNPKPKDIDLAVFIDDNTFNTYLRNAFNGKVKLNGDIVDISKYTNEVLLKLADDILINDSTNAASRTFAYAIKHGKISASTKPRIISGQKEIVRELNRKYPSLNIEDISIQKTGSKLELKPDLKIEKL